MRRWSLLFMALVGSQGCADPLGIPESGVHPAIVELNGETIISVPSDAQVGEDIVISIGSFSNERLGKRSVETRVTLEGMSVVIEPFDDFTHLGPMVSMTVRLDHDVTLSFPAPGRMSVEVRGRSAPGYNAFSRTYFIQVS